LGLVLFWLLLGADARLPAADNNTSAGQSGAVQPGSKRWEKLIGDLRSKKTQVRVAAADALAAMGAGAKAATADLIRAMEDNDFWASAAVINALSAIGAPAVPALVDVLENGQDSMRLRAVWALRTMGPAAKAALPTLRKASHDKMPRIRDLAAQTLEELEGGGENGPAKQIAARITSRAAVLPSFGRDISADWPQFHGPRRDALCSETGLLTQWPAEGPRLLWKWEGAGRGYSSVSIVQGKLYTMGDRSAGDTESQFVLALDLVTQKEIWAARVGPPHADGPRCTPTVDGKLLYALGTDGDLVCLETATGKECWHKNLAKDFGGQMMSMWKFSESPLVDGDRLICTPGGKDAALVALNKETGEVIWKSWLPELGGKGKDGAGYCSAVVAEFDGVRQYVQIVGRGAVGVAADTGKFLWGYNRIANEVANIPTPIVRGNYVFVTTGYHTGAALLKISRKGDGFAAEEVYFIDPNRFENHHGGVVLVGDYLYGGHGLNRGQPICIHLPTGEIAWKAKQPFPGSAAVLYADGHLIFRYDRGDVALIEATPQEFRVKASFKPITADGPAWAHPVIHDKRLYLRHGNVLACYDLRP
jgi:outer membrane protein assembly factor BamB